MACDRLRSNLTERLTEVVDMQTKVKSGRAWPDNCELVAIVSRGRDDLIYPTCMKAISCIKIYMTDLLAAMNAINDLRA